MNLNQVFFKLSDTHIVEIYLITIWTHYIYIHKPNTHTHTRNGMQSPLSLNKVTERKWKKKERTRKKVWEQSKWIQEITTNDTSKLWYALAHTHTIAHECSWTCTPYSTTLNGLSISINGTQTMSHHLSLSSNRVFTAYERKKISKLISMSNDSDEWMNDWLTFAICSSYLFSHP